MLQEIIARIDDRPVTQQQVSPLERTFYQPSVPFEQPAAESKSSQPPQPTPLPPLFSLAAHSCKLTARLGGLLEQSQSFLRREYFGEVNILAQKRLNVPLVV